jgi:hypothetical protein
MWSSGGRHVVEFDGVVNLGGLGSEDVAIPVLARHFREYSSQDLHRDHTSFMYLMRVSNYAA